MVHVQETLLGLRLMDESLTRTQTIGTSDSQIAPRNPNRAELILVNRSGNVIDVGPIDGITSDEGFRVAPNGGSLTVLVQEDGELVQREWHAVAGAAGSSLEVFGLVVQDIGGGA